MYFSVHSAPLREIFFKYQTAISRRDAEVAEIVFSFFAFDLLALYSS